MSQAARLLSNKILQKHIIKESRAALLIPKLIKINESFSKEDLIKLLKDSSNSVYRGDTELKSDSNFIYLQNPTSKQRISQVDLKTGLFNMCG